MCVPNSEALNTMIKMIDVVQIRMTIKGLRLRAKWSLFNAYNWMKINYVWVSFINELHKKNLDWKRGEKQVSVSTEDRSVGHDDSSDR